MAIPYCYNYSPSRNNSRLPGYEAIIMAPKMYGSCLLTVDCSGQLVVCIRVHRSIGKKALPFRAPRQIGHLVQQLSWCSMSTSLSVMVIQGLTDIAKSLQSRERVEFPLSSSSERSKRPVAAIVAAELSAGRGGGTVGASKSQGTMPSSGIEFMKSVAMRLEASRYRLMPVFLYTGLIKKSREFFSLV